MQFDCIPNVSYTFKVFYKAIYKGFFMIFSLKTAELFLRVMFIIAAYVPTVTLAGYMRAKIAKKIGDDLPEDFGFLTLNPLAHISFFSITLTLIFQLTGSALFVGFGNYIPLNRDAIVGRFRWLKIFLVQMTDVITPFILSALSAFFVVLLYSYKAVLLIADPLSFKSISTILGPTASYVSIVGTSFLLVFFVLNYAITVLNFLINTCSLIGYAFRYGKDDQRNGDIVELISILIFWIFLGAYIDKGIRYLILSMADFLTATVSAL